MRRHGENRGEAGQIDRPTDSHVGAGSRSRVSIAKLNVDTITKKIV